MFLVEPHFDMFARCKVNGTTFSSQFNRTERGSTILAYCVDRDIQGVDRVSSYFARVMFFFQRQFIFRKEGILEDRHMVLHMLTGIGSLTLIMVWIVHLVFMLFQGCFTSKVKSSMSGV